FQADADTVMVSGKIITNQSAHSVILIDDRGDKSDYWSRSYAARIAADGTFQIQVNHPAQVEGEYRILFCLDDGIVTGNGTNIGPRTRGDIRKRYRFTEGKFIFDE